ncbi:MAG TPA: GAF domain-containing SpoIIE family protein phosphatase [Mycobacteriales bacterium]|nr:GAF domain-containing SpoIIE family protein phosphatase [Mycobacteriales bacterium]
MADLDAAAAAALLGFLRRTHLSGPADIARVAAEQAAEFGASDLVLYLADYEQRRLIPVEQPAEPVPIEGTLVGRAFATTSILRTDAGDGTRLILPLLDGTERLGVLELTVPGPEDDVPIELVSVAERFAHLVAQTVVVKSSYGDTFELVRRRRPMEISAELIRGMLPPLVFATEQIVIAGLLEPSYSVGGDSFDYAVNGPVAHLALFDAMGHGLAAAGDASFAIAGYRAARRRGLGLVETYREMDAAIQHQTGERFVTALLAQLDLDTGQLRWLSAGHPAPLLVREGKFIKELQTEPHTPLGVAFGGSEPVVSEESLQPGDLVLFYTDGLPEARLPDGEFFTVERLAEFIERQAAADLAAPETLRRLRHAVLEHQHGALQDDASALLVQWSGDGPRRLLPETVL